MQKLTATPRLLPQRSSLRHPFKPSLLACAVSAALLACATSAAYAQTNADAGRASLLLGYSFGKAQRLLAGVDPTIGPLVVHGAVEPINDAYRAAGVALPPTLRLEQLRRHDDQGLGRAGVSHRGGSQ